MKLTKSLFVSLIGMVAGGVALDLVLDRNIWRPGGIPGAALVALIICGPIFIALDLLRWVRAAYSPTRLPQRRYPPETE